MKKVILSAVGLAAVLTSLPAIAGPDWQVIEKARNAKLAQIRAAQAQKSAGMPAMPQPCQDMIQAPK